LEPTLPVTRDDMRLDAVRRLWQRLVERGPVALDEPGSFTDSEREAGRMVLPLLQDLQEARQAIDGVARHARALETALDHLPVAAIVVDEASHYLTGNAAANRLFGGPAVPQSFLTMAVRAIGAEEPPVAALPGGRAVRVVVGSEPRDEGRSDRPSSRVLFLVPADGSFELETQHLQERFGLTPMQGRVVGLTAQGLTNKEIAARLSVSAETVHKHLATTFQRTGLSTRAGLVALAFGARFGIDFQPL
jgi:DNA-binding CsgD family transcriptional regulator